MRSSQPHRKLALIGSVVLASTLAGPAPAQVKPTPNMQMDCEHSEEAAYASILKSHGLASGDQIGPLLDRSTPGQFPELEAAEFYYRGLIWTNHWRDERKGIDALDAFEREALARLVRSARNQNTMNQIERVGPYPLPVTMFSSCTNNHRAALNQSIREAGDTAAKMMSRFRSKVAEACGLQLSGALEGLATVPVTKREEHLNGYTEIRYGENYTEWEREDRTNKLHVKIKWTYDGVPQRLVPGKEFEIDVKATISKDSPSGTVDGVVLAGHISVYGDLELKKSQEALRPGLVGLYKIAVKPNAKSAEIHFGGAPVGTGAIWKFGLPKN